MITQLLAFLRGDTRTGYDQAFVRGVDVAPPRESRSRRSEWVLVIGWILIVLKCVGAWWVMTAYQVPISPWWVILPTIAAAGVCTLLYIWR